MFPAPLPGSPEKKQESRDAQKVLRLLARKLMSIGFQRTKPTFFTRPGRYVLEFVHVHKYTFGPAFRVHLGVRVRTDYFAAAHLNGPSSDGIADPESPDRRLYDFDFTATEANRESCAEAMHQYVATDGQCWFASIENPAALLSTDSPLAQSARVALQRELEQVSTPCVSEDAQRVLNVASQDVHSK